MKKVIGILSALFVAAAVGALTPAPASAAPQSVVYDCGGAKQVRPNTITVYCGDAGIVVGSIAWGSWGRQTATGTGIEFKKQCSPDCASGLTSTTPVDVLLSQPVNGAFTRIRLTTVGLPNSQSYQLTGSPS